MQINWDIVAAVGTVLGSIATFSAVLVALRQNKPKVKVKTMVGDLIQPGPFGGKVLDKDRLLIIAVNIGSLPVKITHMGLKLPNNYLFITPDHSIDTYPKILMPSEEVSVWTKVNELIDKGIKNYDIAYAVDSSGKYYYHHVSFIRNITRCIWWKFSRFNYESKKKEE